MLRQPGPHATFVRTEFASDEFGILDANLAIEPSEQPGYVRLFRRSSPTDRRWAPAGRILADEAERRYGVPARPDTSD